MRVYFLSYVPAILKLNGLYVGGVDCFERHVELELSDSVLAEIIPGDNLQAVNFFINDKLLFSPPPYLDVYLMSGEALIYVREYAAKSGRLEVISQTRFCGNLVTLFSHGGVYLSVDGGEYNLMPLPQKFSAATFREETLAGYPVLEIRAGNSVVVLSADAEKIFMNEVISIEYGETLRVLVAFETCTAARADCAYSYDGRKLTLVESRTTETRPPEKNIVHFAFFESVLTCGDFERYLDDELLQKADRISGYLGNFIGVTVPTERFYAEHGMLRAAGLVYRKRTNLFEVKYFAVELNGDKISNIFPVEE